MPDLAQHLEGLEASLPKGSEQLEQIHARLLEDAFTNFKHAVRDDIKALLVWVYLVGEDPARVVSLTEGNMPKAVLDSVFKIAEKFYAYQRLTPTLENWQGDKGYQWLHVQDRKKIIDGFIRLVAVNPELFPRENRSNLEELLKKVGLKLPTRKKRSSLKPPD